MSAWQPISTAPKDGTTILVTGGELWDSVGSPSFGGPYCVYWTTNLEKFPEGCWSIKAGFDGWAVCDDPTLWLPIPEPDDDEG